MSATNLPNLHDAVLERVAVDWERASVAIDLTRVPGGATRLLLAGLVSLRLSHREEWGPSAYVNEVRLDELADGRFELRIEMQSGDPITVIARSLAVVPSACSGSPTDGAATVVDALRWHAGLAVAETGERAPLMPVVDVVAPQHAAAREVSVEHLWVTLSQLNLELNGDPEQPEHACRALDANVVYAVEEIVRLLDASRDAGRDLAQELRVAWVAILAGDIPDLRAHVAQERSARRSNGH